ncbi:MAG: 6-bladed beta-propeller [Chloroflexi bacterium]|nr:6-bladed beta-propeller [Chloroflexota bacterium]MDA8189262.1 6-bladed beta-propeller [Dehalococcoidales bacterium]
MSDQETQWPEGGNSSSAPGGGDGAPSTAPEEAGQRRSRRRILIALLVLLLAVIACNAYYMLSRQPITTLPLVRAFARSTPPTYLFSITGLSEPMGIAISPDAQRVYVTELGGERMVRVFDRTGKQIVSFAFPGTKIPDRAPTYPAVDRQGRLYVPERAQHVVAVYSPEGRHLGVFPRVAPGENFAWSPLGVSIGRSGDILVTDTTVDEHSVYIFDSSGQLRKRFGKSGSGNGEFDFPNQAAVDHRSRIYVTDGNNGRVSIFDADGNHLGYLGVGNAPGAVGLPRGLAIDSMDRLHVVDSINGRVQVFDVSGDKPSFLFTIGAASSARPLALPNGVAVDDTGRVYIANTAENEVQVWTY